MPLNECEHWQSAEQLIGTVNTGNTLCVAKSDKHVGAIAEVTSETEVPGDATPREATVTEFELIRWRLTSSAMVGEGKAAVRNSDVTALPIEWLCVVVSPTSSCKESDFPALSSSSVMLRAGVAANALLNEPNTEAVSNSSMLLDIRVVDMACHKESRIGELPKASEMLGRRESERLLINESRATVLTSEPPRTTVEEKSEPLYIKLEDTSELLYTTVEETSGPL